jgi:hypothetical protein
MTKRPVTWFRKASINPRPFENKRNPETKRVFSQSLRSKNSQQFLAGKKAKTTNETAICTLLLRLRLYPIYILKMCPFY